MEEEHDDRIDAVGVSRQAGNGGRKLRTGVVSRHPGGLDGRCHGAGGTDGSGGLPPRRSGGYIESRRDIPQPSPGRKLPLVALPAPVAAKIALYRAMCECGLGNAAMAKRLGTVEGTVRCLLDLDHRSHIGQVEAALHVLGQRLVVATRAA